MAKVRPWCGQPSDRGRLKNRTDCLHSPSTASVAGYRRSACIDMDMLRLAAVACCDMG